MQVLIILWREPPEGGEFMWTSGSSKFHPPEVYRWRWLVVAYADDRRFDTGIENTKSNALIAARLYAVTHGFKIKGG